MHNYSSSNINDGDVDEELLLALILKRECKQQQKIEQRVSNKQKLVRNLSLDYLIGKLLSSTRKNVEANLAPNDFSRQKRLRRHKIQAKMSAFFGCYRKSKQIRCLKRLANQRPPLESNVNEPVRNKTRERREFIDSKTNQPMRIVRVDRVVTKASTASPNNQCYAPAAAAKKRSVETLSVDDEADSNDHLYPAKRRALACQGDDNEKKTTIDHEEAKARLFASEMSEKDLWRLTCTYESLVDWKRIGEHLGLSGHDLLMIESKHCRFDGVRECLYQSLLRWRLVEPQNCHFSYLSQILTFKVGVCAEQMDLLAETLIAAKTMTTTMTTTSLAQHLSTREIESAEKLELCNKQMWLASDLLCMEWKELARQLDLSECDIGQIERKYLSTDGIRECCYQSLLLWSQLGSNSTTRMTLAHLLVALVHLKLNLYARQLAAKFLATTSN